MATVGVGVDMLEIARMERVLARRPSFAHRVFSDEERSYCERCARPAEHYAVRFAAREAVVKALGTGFGSGVGWGDVSVVRDELGRPRARLTGRAAAIADGQGVREVVISLSHTHDVAVANAVAVTDGTRPAPQRPPDDREREMLRSFKAARTVIDELERLQADELAGLAGVGGVPAQGDVRQHVADGAGGGGAASADAGNPRLFHLGEEEGARGAQEGE